MPMYCYTHEESGMTIERKFGMGRAVRTVFHDGKKFNRDVVAEHRDSRDTPGNYPMWSDAMGVLPSQAKELNDHLAKHGVAPCQVDREGRIKLESRHHRNQVLKARNLRDKNAGYGDWAGRNG